MRIFSMVDPQQQPPSSYYRKPYASNDSDQPTPQSPNDSNRQAARVTNVTNPSTSNQTPKTSHGPSLATEQSKTSSSFNQTHSAVANEKLLPPKPSSSSDTRSTTAPLHESYRRSDHLNVSDYALMVIALSPAAVHLWGRCFAQNPAPRQLGTWFALLTLPISVPLYRWEKVPHLARDVLELMSYGSALTVTIDITVVSYQYMTAVPPTSEWQWLIFYPATVAAVASWLVIVGLMWALVIR